LSHPVHARRLYYAEEFYLYVMNLYYTNAPLERNIRFMQWALEAPFDNPVRSLALIKTEADYERYKSLFKMHVCLLIIDSYMQLGRRFDKENVYFFNLWYADRLKKSFTIAEYYYRIGFNYWEETKKYAAASAEIPGRINIDEWEDELYLIQEGELDYEVIIQSRLDELSERIMEVDTYIARFENTTN
jgi:hypothetical protein